MMPDMIFLHLNVHEKHLSTKNGHGGTLNFCLETPDTKKSSATAEIDDGPCGASTLSSWRRESSNISLVVLDKLLYYSRNLIFFKIANSRTDRQTDLPTDNTYVSLLTGD